MYAFNIGVYILYRRKATCNNLNWQSLYKYTLYEKEAKQTKMTANIKVLPRFNLIQQH